MCTRMTPENSHMSFKERAGTMAVESMRVSNKNKMNDQMGKPRVSTSAFKTAAGINPMSPDQRISALEKRIAELQGDGGEQSQTAPSAPQQSGSVLAGPIGRAETQRKTLLGA